MVKDTHGCMDLEGTAERGFTVCVYIQMVSWRRWYYCFSLSVAHQGGLMQHYPLPAHMLSLPFLT